MENSMATVEVRGRAVVPARPDEIGLTIALDAVRTTSREAVAEVARRSQILGEIFDELGIDERARTTSGVTVQEERDYQNGRYVHRGYRAHNEIAVRLDDAALATRLLDEATERAQAHVEGPQWRVSLTNPARIEACRAAAVDARRKAEAYAGALGVRLGTIVRVSEPDMSVRPMPQYEVHALASAPPPDEAEITIEAGDLDVTAAVEVSFRLEQE